MDSFAAGEGSRSDSRERRNDSQHRGGKNKKDCRKQNRGSNWQRHDNVPKQNFVANPESNRPDFRRKIPSLKCEGVPPSSKRLNKSVKAECFLNLVYEDDRSVRRERLPKSSSSRKGGHSTRRTVYTTENYMQANCQFVVDSNCSSLAAKLGEDPDYAPPWDTICEVRLIASSEPNCPICMNRPVARRITTCGHIFCLPCLIHYFTIKAEQTIPCPICFTKIDISSIKPVSVVHCMDYAIGDTISFVLSRCLKGTTVVETMGANSQTCRLSNVIFASKAEMICRLDADRTVLSGLLKNYSDCQEDEATFISEAIKLLENDIQQLEMSEESQGQTIEILGVSPPKPENIVFYVDAFDEQQKQDSSKPEAPQLDICNDSPVSPLDSDLLEEPATVENKQENQMTDIDNSHYYFYQSMDGQRIYLSSFNVRCLLRQFGHLSRCPTVLSGKIEAIDYVNVTAAFRSQFRYMSHLPLNSHCQSAEIEMSSFLSAETLEQFSDEIQRRKSDRVLKQTKEEAYSRRAECLTERMTKAVSEITPIALDEPLVYDHAAFLADSPSLFSNEGAGNTEQSPNDASRPSFAKILAEGRSVETFDFPQLGSPPSLPASPAALLVTAPNSRASSSASRVLHKSTSPGPLAKVQVVKHSSSLSVPSQSNTAGQRPPVPMEAEDEELAYAAPEAPKTLADCLSNLNLSQESPSSGSNWRKGKKKSEVKLLFSSGRGHSLLN